jgi:potassium/hydrogen antiporter
MGSSLILIGLILLFVSLVVSRQTKYGIPILLLFLFLLVGMLAGSDAPGGLVLMTPK